MVLKTDYIDGNVYYAGSVNEIGTTINAHAGSLSNLGVGYHRISTAFYNGEPQRDTDDTYDVVGSIVLSAGGATTYAECRMEIYASTSLVEIGNRQWLYKYKISKWSDAGSTDLKTNESFWKTTGSSNSSSTHWTHATYSGTDLVAGSEVKFVLSAAIEESTGTSGSGIMTCRGTDGEIWGI